MRFLASGSGLAFDRNGPRDHDGCMTASRQVSRPGPRRPRGAPTGPQEVREAVLESAATLFALRGVDGVSLRDVAGDADVNVALIRRYVGSRDALIEAVFEHVSIQLAEVVEAHPLAAQGFEADTVMGKWVRIAASLSLSGRRLPGPGGINPVAAMAHTLSTGYGVSEDTARLRAAQIVAAALGWRIFEEYLVDAAELTEVPLELLREELARTARRVGATPWPSPPDPAAVGP